MVLSFIRSDTDPGDFGPFVSRSLAMLEDAHHSFELASRCLLTDDRADSIAQDIRDTDRRINQTEQELRRELVGHVAINGSGDIGSVLGFTVLIKKIERVGDHAKNILELTENGISLANVPETEELLAERDEISSLFLRTAELLEIADLDPDDIRAFADQVNSLIAICQARIDSYLVSDRPGREVVPLAAYNRFLRRIAANLLGVVRAWAEP
jgi:phosphate uptake regulator